MNFYSFHIGDYTSHTKHLTPLEDICYRRLLDLYYMAEEAIPSDIDKVARLISMRDHSDIVSDILNEFFVKLPDGSFMNQRASNEIERYHDKATRARKANQSRWGNPTEKESEMDLKSEAVQIPTNTITKNHKPKKEEELPEAFLMFWAAYPRKTAKGAALAAWRKANPPPIETLLSAVKKQRQSPEWNKERGAFIPHPSTWLNQRRWDDEGIDYAVLSGRGAVGASSSQESAHQIDEQHAKAWLEEVYGKVEGAGRFLEWPPNVRRDYLNQRSRN